MQLFLDTSSIKRFEVVLAALVVFTAISFSEGVSSRTHGVLCCVVLWCGVLYFRIVFRLAFRCLSLCHSLCLSLSSPLSLPSPLS
jgi:hypothetical protein